MKEFLSTCWPRQTTFFLSFRSFLFIKCERNSESLFLLLSAVQWFSGRWTSCRISCWTLISWCTEHTAPAKHRTRKSIIEKFSMSVVGERYWERETESSMYSNVWPGHDVTRLGRLRVNDVGGQDNNTESPPSIRAPPCLTGGSLQSSTATTTTTPTKTKPKSSFGF